MKYYLIAPSGVADEGVACSSADTDLVDVHDLLRDGCSEDTWKSLNLELKDGKFTDFQVNDLALRLCSNKLRDVLEIAKHPNDRFCWLPARVSGRHFNVLHLPETHPNVLNESLCIYHKDILVAPVISKDFRAGVFKRLKDNAFETIVSAKVRAALLESCCTGLGFEEVASG